MTVPCCAFSILPVHSCIKVCAHLTHAAVQLDDSMVTMSTILSSRFVAGIRDEVEKMESALRLFQDTLDSWLALQKTWMYLENIFGVGSQDIQKQLPNDHAEFTLVDALFKDVMRKVFNDNPNAMKACTTMIPNLLQQFQNANEKLENIQKNLEDWLESKRNAFPRFYFLSNDELLEILAQTRNVQAVQPHMIKCFDGIKALDFGADPKSVDIYGMISPEGEKVSLGKNLKAGRQSVEFWLKEVERKMVENLRKQAKTTLNDFDSGTIDRCSWAKRDVAQLIIMVSQIDWCRRCTACFKGQKDAVRKAQVEVREFCVQQLKDMCMLVRTNLTYLERSKIGSLMTIDVHNRDIVEYLIEGNVHKENEFGWQVRLRYYWDENQEDCRVLQMNAGFNYAYEYLGASTRLVITPLTDRCYMTITGALNLRLGGAPAGPAGTGKTESVKDLAKALGRQCVVFNCGDNLDFKFMAKFFCGLVQCGAWACLDEFNRINLEVLSVVAQQLLVIQLALKAGVPTFEFEGQVIPLVTTCGVFITMNPGYAGRSELPDNLKMLFRPVSMMIPDYALVAEVIAALVFGPIDSQGRCILISQT